MNRTVIYTVGLAIILGILFALALWYGYLQKQSSSQTLDSVFASYSPSGGGGGGGSGRVVQNGTPQAATTKPQTPDEFSNTQKKQVTSERIVEAPVGAGSDIVGESVRYVDRAKGYIYETSLQTGKTERISNIILPGAFDVRFVSTNEAIVQTLDEDGTIVAHGLSFTKNGTATDTPIPLAILDMAIDDETSLIYALVRADGGGVALVTFEVPYDTSQKPTVVWTSSLTNWRLSTNTVVDGKKALVLQQKASNNIPGHSYTLETRTKKMAKILGDTPGLTTLRSPSGLYTFVTTADGTAITSSIRTEKTGELKSVERVSFPEKCVWVAGSIENGGGESLLCGFPKTIPLAGLPDVWYRGEFIFDDVLGSVDLTTGKVTEVETKLDSPVDMTNLKLTAGGSTLVFTDKKSGSLWTVKNLR